MYSIIIFYLLKLVIISQIRILNISVENISTRIIRVHEKNYINYVNILFIMWTIHIYFQYYLSLDNVSVIQY